MSAGHVSRVVRPRSWLKRVVFLTFVAYLAYALGRVELTPDRIVKGFEFGAQFLDKLFPPDFGRTALLMKGLKESLEIAILASVLGVIVSLPVSLLAARNLMPPWITWPVRTLLVLCRSFHPVIVAILFVKAVGFGALAGILALTVASLGFLGKLYTEAIEEISLKQVEAIRATGASFMNVIVFGVVPQVLARFVGFSSYELDANLRNSTLVGIVGAGGIGGTLFAAFQRFDYDFVCAIILAIIAMIVIGELLTNAVKRVFRA
jgi:phosphonate transport system permease protein